MSSEQQEDLCRVCHFVLRDRGPPITGMSRYSSPNFEHSGSHAGQTPGLLMRPELRMFHVNEPGTLHAMVFLSIYRYLFTF